MLHLFLSACSFAGCLVVGVDFAVGDCWLVDYWLLGTCLLVGECLRVCVAWVIWLSFCFFDLMFVSFGLLIDL